MVFTGSTVPGVYVQQPSPISTAQLGSIDEFKSIIIIGTAASGNANTLTDIYSVTDFSTKFPTSPCLPHITSLFANYPALSTTSTTRPSRIKFFKATDSGGSPTTTTHLTAGIAALTLVDETPLGILLCPEAFTVTNAPETATLFGLLDTLAQAKGMLLFADFRSTVTTAALLATAADGYLAAKRAVAGYFGWNLENSINVPISVIAAAQALRCFDERGQFVPPAGKYQIANSVPVPALQTAANQAVISDKRVNFVKRVGVGGITQDVVWGARMMSTDEAQGWFDINSFISSVITERTVTRNFEVFQAIADATINALSLKATLQATLENLSAAGAYQLNVTLPRDFVIQTASGQIQTLARGRQITRGFEVFEPLVLGRRAFLDFVYLPTITSEQVIIRPARIAI